MSSLPTIDSSGAKEAASHEKTGRKSYRGPGKRLYGIDAARAIAVVGMVMVHFGPNPVPETALGGLYALSSGRASVLFVLLAGVGVALLSARRAPGRYSRGGLAVTRGQLVVRGALLLPIGLWLQSLDHGVLVILQYYAIYFLLAALVLSLPDSWLLAATAIALICGPLAYLGGAMVAPELYVGQPVAIGDTSGKLVRDLLLSGAYPLLTWSAPLLAGIWIGRRDLSAPSVRWSLLIGGLAVAVAAALCATALIAVADPQVGEPSLAYLATDEPHSQMPLWMAGAIGSACAVLGGMLLVADGLTRTIWPLIATGQLALSVYVGHLLFLAAYAELVRHEEVPAAFLTVGAFMLGVALLCVLWRTMLPRGPLEALLAAPWWMVERFTRLE
jgi:uncharacterized membrane protein